MKGLWLTGLVLMTGVWIMDAIGEAEERTWMDFRDGRTPFSLRENHVKAKVVKRNGDYELKVHFRVANYPNVFFACEGKPWDWSGYSGIKVDIFNPASKDIQVHLRVDNAGGDGFKNSNTSSTVAVPGGVSTLKLYFRTVQHEDLWGMRGLPRSGPVGWGTSIDPSRVSAFQVFLNHPSEEHLLFLDDFRLFGEGGEVPFPFVDRYGQYIHGEWPGKLHREEQLQERAEVEEKQLDQWKIWDQRDEYGGWSSGPRLEATGWFRTEELDGRWWLVTPKGTLFFSLGVDCVGTWEKTFVEGRKDWFEWLPEKDNRFGEFYGHSEGAHSMADPIEGKGETYSFYCANLMRKYGDDWAANWRENAYRRLKGWGFNTVANWSQGDVLEHSPMPYVVSCGISGSFRMVEGAKGYWGKMKDVFDPGFPKAVVQSLSHVGTFHAGNPLCLGYFVDNELSWEAVRKGVLESPPDQPARRVQIEGLKEKYGSLEKLNQAWEAKAEGWDSLRVPEDLNDACKEDLEKFLYEFALQYFQTIADALKVHAPHQLYLGCRFAGAPNAAVRACAEAADVVSFNFYRTTIDCDKYLGEGNLGKPIIIGEFHFGALDRGMFHTGLVPTKDQEARAEAYKAYVRSVADCPAFVGCHWFQYIDEPITGRWFDGENYNIGFVSVVDFPYPELVQAARDVHQEIYQRRLDH